MNNGYMSTATSATTSTTAPERSGSAAIPAPPNPEVLARPRRRRFSLDYKQRIVQEASRCSEPGQIGALLRREGLYSSHLVEWCRRESQTRSASRSGRAVAPHVAHQNRQLRRENSQLKRRLAQADAIIEIQKKVADLLGITLATTPSDGSE